MIHNGPVPAGAFAYRGRVASSRRLRALITNDDGIDSPGLWTLAAGAQDAGFDVVVAAPHIDSSGVGASVLAVRDGDATKLYPREIDALPGVPAFAVEGHPAFIVHAAGRGWLDPEPDIVLSGVNLGANVGRAVLHSGTVGAALTAALHGWYGLAVSLDCRLGAAGAPALGLGATRAARGAGRAAGRAGGTVLSLNVPDRPVGELRGAAGGAAGPVRGGAGAGEPPQRGRRRRADRRCRGAVDAAGPGTDLALLPTVTRRSPSCSPSRTGPGCWTGCAARRAAGRLTRPAQCSSAPVSSCSSRSATVTTSRNGRSKPSTAVSSSGMRVPEQHHPVDADHATGLGLAGRREQPDQVQICGLADR